ncbi:MAG: hypothetical protein JNK58_04420 [Phycisphaerae bacterium]|nr:hypothetical protein [Phycisphaerae bacterium]
MNSKVINTIGVCIAVLVGGWAYYAVLSTIPAPAPAAVPPAPTAPGPMSIIAAHQAATNAAINAGGPAAAPSNVPVDPNAPGAMGPNQDGTQPPAQGPPGPIPGAAPPKRTIAVEKWDFDLEKKPFPIDVK